MISLHILSHAKVLIFDTKFHFPCNGTSTELHEWSENMVENYNFLKVNCRFLLVSWVKWKQSVCSKTLLYSSTFNSLFLPFFVLEIFKFNFNWFKQPCDLPNVFSVLKVLVIQSCFCHQCFQFAVIIIEIGNQAFIFHSIERENFAAAWNTKPKIIRILEEFIVNII